MTAKLENLTKDLEELKSLLDSANRQRVKDALSLEIKRIETEMSLLRDSIPSGKIASSPISVEMTKNKCYDVKITNYGWDQSDKYVKIFVSLDNVHTLPAEKISCVFKERAMELTIKELGNRNYLFSINNLLDTIDASNSSWKVKTGMVVVMMAKASVGKTWNAITALEAAAKESKKPPLPPSDGASDDMSAGLMNMMKNMYDEGDDEMKRTIAKAWSQSVSTRDTPP